MLSEAQMRRLGLHSDLEIRDHVPKTEQNHLIEDVTRIVDMAMNQV